MRGCGSVAAVRGYEGAVPVAVKVPAIMGIRCPGVCCCWFRRQPLIYKICISRAHACVQTRPTKCPSQDLDEQRQRQ